jgi:hypothetical protein
LIHKLLPAIFPGDGKSSFKELNLVSPLLKRQLAETITLPLCKLYTWMVRTPCTIYYEPTKTPKKKDPRFAKPIKKLIEPNLSYDYTTSNAISIRKRDALADDKQRSQNQNLTDQVIALPRSGL